MSEQTTFKQRTLAAAEGVDKGEPLKDFLDDDEIEDAVKLLASVYFMAEDTLNMFIARIENFHRDGEEWLLSTKTVLSILDDCRMLANRDPLKYNTASTNPAVDKLNHFPQSTNSALRE